MASGGQGRNPRGSSGEAARRHAQLRRAQYRRRRLFAGVVAGAFALIVLIGVSGALGGSDSSDEVDGPDSPSDAALDWAAERQARLTAAASERAVSDALQMTTVLRRGSGEVPQIALTFDDGPGESTPEILDILDKYEVSATFFVIGGAHDRYGSLIKEEIARGHVVANHTVGHPAMDGLSAEEQASEIDRQTQAIMTFGAPRPRFFRPPYNAWNDVTLELVRRREMLMVLWSVETNDWAKPGVDTIVEQTLANAHPGAIVLFHDGGGDRTQTVEALPRVIEGLQDDGYELVTIPTLIKDGMPTEDQR